MKITSEVLKRKDPSFLIVSLFCSPTVLNMTKINNLPSNQLNSLNLLKQTSILSKQDLKLIAELIGRWKTTLFLRKPTTL